MKMKKRLRYEIMLLLLVLSGGVSCLVALTGKTWQVVSRRPDNFVNIRYIVPGIQLDMRYFSTDNFVGKSVKGYHAPVCLLTRKAARAIRKVQNRLIPMGLSLKVYDCYRPQMAVNHFATWAKNITDRKMKARFYPDIEKKNLFSQGYIALHSSHSRGSTLDLTIVPQGSTIPKTGTSIRVSCLLPQKQRANDNSLDFGTGFDCFSPLAHPSYPDLSPQIKANRLLLQTLMMDAGFRPIKTEWWHFTLMHEPYPDTYFNFPVK